VAKVDFNLAWGHPDGGVAPDALPDPWTLVAVGGGSTVTTDRFWTITAPNARSYEHVMQPGDPIGAERARPDDDMEWQGACEIGAGSATDGRVGFWITDRNRWIGISIGSSLNWVDPAVYTTVLSVISTSFSQFNRNVFHLKKNGTGSWQLYVNGELVSTIPYQLAPSSVAVNHPISKASFGTLGPLASGATVAQWGPTEMGLNIALPPQWKVDKTFLSLAAPLQNRWNRLSRGLLRASVGVLERSVAMLNDAFVSKTAQSQQITPHYFQGDVRPDLIIPAWLVTATVSVVRERVRLDSTAAISQIQADMSATPLPTEASVGVAARVLLQSTIPFLNGSGITELGPEFNVFDGVVRLKATLTQIPGGTADDIGWTLANTATAVSLSGRYWRVDPFQEHHVEVRIFRDRDCWLFVDRIPVDWVPYGDIPAAVLVPRVLIQSGAGPASTRSVLDVWDVLASDYRYDSTRRALFDQSCIERLVHVGGCERNDLLEMWKERRHQAIGNRGTTEGIELEIIRMTCQRHAYVIQVVTPSEWYLDVTFPDITPIWLDAPGSITDSFVEWAVWPPNFTRDSFADLLAHYYVPSSSLDLRYWICLIAVGTANFVIGGPVVCNVESSSGFAIGDEVTVRTFDNTTSETATVTADPPARRRSRLTASRISTSLRRRPRHLFAWS